MREVSSALSSFLNAGTPCVPVHIYTITLAGGTVLRWTDHESNLVHGGQTYTAGGTGTVPLIVYRGCSHATGTEITTCTVELGCGDTARVNGKRIPLAALDGEFRGAWVKVERVFSPADIATHGVMWIFEGPISQPSPSSTGVELTIESGQALLTQQMPRVTYQAGCVHSLYSAECGISKAARTEAGTVDSGATTTTLTTSNVTLTDGYFNRGVITFTSGALTGLTRAIRSSVPIKSGPTNIAQTFTLDRALPSAPAAGVTFTIFPGCDKTRATCAGKFSNLARFRGFPYVPKNESGKIG